MLDSVLCRICREIGRVEGFVGGEYEAPVVGAREVAGAADDADVGAELQVVIRLGQREVLHELEALLRAPLRLIHGLPEVSRGPRDGRGPDRAIRAGIAVVVALARLEAKLVQRVIRQHQRVAPHAVLVAREAVRAAVVRVDLEQVGDSKMERY